MLKKEICQTQKDQEKLLELFLLRASASWLERQNWTSSPYGGPNPVQHLIDHLKMLSSQQWEEVFQNGNQSLHPETLAELYEALKAIDPLIQQFYDKTMGKK